MLRAAFVLSYHLGKGGRGGCKPGGGLEGHILHTALQLPNSIKVPGNLPVSLYPQYSCSDTQMTLALCKLGT